MALFPRERSIDSMPQLNQYLNRHNGSVSGFLSYVVTEDIGGSTDEREDFGKIIINTETEPPSVEFRARDMRESDIDYPVTIDEKFIATEGVDLAVYSRHKV